MNEHKIGEEFTLDKNYEATEELLVEAIDSFKKKIAYEMEFKDKEIVMSANKSIAPPISVLVSASVIDKFNKYRQGNYQNEACGILIGTHSIDESKITITFATAPDRNDKQSRFSFKIKSKRHNKTLQNRFSKSGGREVYLGTWHTHPEDHPNPSKCDTDDWLKQYSINRHLFESMLFVIVGIKTNKWFLVSDNGILILDSKVIYNENKRKK